MAKSKSRDYDRDDRPKRVEPVKRDGAYVMMLFITFVATTVGCVLLYLDNEEYGGKSPPKAPPPDVMKLGEAPKAESLAAPPAGGPMPKGDPMMP
ncbi:MAG TPA: hypothetical protein VGE74_30715 [Gemmata sp.]